MTPTPVRKRRNRIVTRQSQDVRVGDILKAARTIISHSGYEGVTVAEIAERAGIVEGTVYRYFKSKEELLLKVAEDWFTESFADLVDVSAFSGTYNKLRYLVWHTLKTIKASPAISRYLLTEVRPKPDYKETMVFELNRRYTEQIRSFFAEAIASGEFSHDVPERLLRDMVFGTIEHSTWRFLRGEGDFDPAQIADEIAAVIYRGMSAKAPEDDKFAVLLARLETVADRLEKKA